MSISMCNRSSLPANVSGVSDSAFGGLRRWLLTLGQSAQLRLGRNIAAIRRRQRDRQTAAALRQLQDSVLEDIGFRRVDICGRPLRGGQQLGPTAIEPIDEPHRGWSGAKPVAAQGCPSQR
jgi:uncharacterized protein YjiS (DUF1127 family)